MQPFRNEEVYIISFFSRSGLGFRSKKSFFVVFGWYFTPCIQIRGSTYFFKNLNYTPPPHTTTTTHLHLQLHDVIYPKTSGDIIIIFFHVLYVLFSDGEGLVIEFKRVWGKKLGSVLENVFLGPPPPPPPINFVHDHFFIKFQLN